MKRILISRLLIICILASTLLCIQACGKNKQGEIPSEPTVFNKIVHKVCPADTTQRYEIYIPFKVKKGEKYPIIYLFDSHADGRLAISNFQKAAEKYGFILVGSDNSENGLSTLDHTLDILLTDVRSSLPIDTKRQYAVGFSGGGRVAFYLATKDNSIKSIITCGAGLSNNSFPSFDVCGIAGRGDFNYPEVMQIEQQLFSQQHLTLSFDGSHAWPPANIVDKALLWLQFNAMRNKYMEKNKEWITAVSSKEAAEIKTFESQNRYLYAYNECIIAKQILKDLLSTDQIEQQQQQIENSAEYQNELQHSRQIEEKEQTIRQELLQAFIYKNSDWWSAKIQEIKQSAEKDSDPEHDMYNRLNGFLGIVCYSYAKQAAESNNQTDGAKIIRIYKMIEPKNPDCFFFNALLADKAHKTNDAVVLLREAIKNGFHNKVKINNSFSAEVKAKLKEE
jgi:hypothetical protein